MLDKKSNDNVFIKTYSHIYDRAKKNTNTIDAHYSRNDLLSLMVLRSCKTNLYYVFDTYMQAMKYIDNLKQCDRTMHEVIFGYKPQKLKFDIDIKENELDEFNINDIVENININDVINDNYEKRKQKTENINNIKIKNIILTLIDKIKEIMLIQYNYELCDSNIIITDNSGKDKNENMKYSYHIIINNYYVSDCKEAQFFTKEVMKLLEIKYYKFIDSHVNKEVQNFRMINCQKTETNRFKKLMSNKNQQLIFGYIINNCMKESETIITNIENCVKIMSNNVKAQRVIPEGLYTQDEIIKILEIAKDVTVGFKLRTQKNKMLIFERIIPTFCIMCNEVHHNDNTLMLFVDIIIIDKFNNNNDKKEVSIMQIYMKCRHNAEKSLYVGKIIRGENNLTTDEKNEIEKEYTIASQIKKVEGWKEMKIKNEIEMVNNNNNKEDLKNKFTELPNEQKNIYCEDQLKEYEFKETLVIKAAMKMGKTKKLMEFIDKYYYDSNNDNDNDNNSNNDNNNDGNKLNESKIVILSFRQTWSTSVKEKFPSFTLYSDVKGQLTQNKVIVQIESLQRLQIHGRDPPDCVILDECESIFEQFDSGNVKEFNKVFATFQYLIKYAKQVILMDAHISDRTYNLLQHFRGIKSLYYHCNEYMNAKDTNYYFTSKQGMWLNELMKSIESGKKVGIPISSLAEAQTILSHLELKYPEKKIKLYSSMTSTEEKKEHFGNVNEFWLQYDVLIYTPTVSAGVSFEQAHYDEIFGYFTDKSCNVETCIQMIGRIRQVNDKKVSICFVTGENKLPIRHDEIEIALQTNRENLLKNTTTTLLTFEYGPMGEMKHIKTDYYYIWMENTIMRNKSMNLFEHRFINYIAETGSKCQIMESLDDDKIILKELMDKHKQIKKTIKYDKIKCIDNAIDLSDEEVKTIQEKFIAQELVTAEEQYAYERYKLRRDYRWINKQLSINFIEKYNDIKMKHIYRNLVRINANESMEVSLNEIQMADAMYYKRVLENGEQHEDLNHNYTYEKHRLACGLLKACGFKSINDTDWLPMIILKDSLRKGAANIYSSLNNIHHEFGIYRTKDQLETANTQMFVENMIKFTNRVLQSQYGMKIDAEYGIDDNVNNKLFKLKQCELFTTNKDDADIKPYVGLSENNLAQEAMIIEYDD